MLRRHPRLRRQIGKQSALIPKSSAHETPHRFVTKVNHLRSAAQSACFAHKLFRAFLIITTVLAFQLQASSAPTAASPPLPPPRPAEAPSHPAPNALAPAEQTAR